MISKLLLALCAVAWCATDVRSFGTDIGHCGCMCTNDDTVSGQFTSQDDSVSFILCNFVCHLVAAAGASYKAATYPQIIDFLFVKGML